VNWRAVLALATGCAVAFVGLLYAPLRVLYDYAWFVGFAVSFVAYFLLMAADRTEQKSPA
jgi:NCS1 family nucleobase:cation symporter-1